MLHNLLGKFVLGILSIALFTGCELPEEFRTVEGLIPEKVTVEWLESLDLSTLDPSLRAWLESLDLSTLDPSLREWLESLDLSTLDPSLRELLERLGIPNQGTLNSSRNNPAIFSSLLPISEDIPPQNPLNLGGTNTVSGSLSNANLISIFQLPTPQPPLLPPLVPSDSPVTIREPDSIAGLLALTSLLGLRKLLSLRRRF